MKSRYAAALIMVLLSLGCARQVGVAPPALTVEIKIAQVLNGISQACFDITSGIARAMPRNTQERRDILAVVHQVRMLNGEARKALEAISANPLATPADVVAAVKPVIASAQRAVADGLVGIKNPESKEKAQLWLLAIQTGITVAQTVMEVTNNGR